jgi:hypothetical protein
VNNDAELRLEDAVMNLLECPTSKLDDAKLNLGLTLALHDCDRAALMRRADLECTRYRALLTQDHSDRTYRTYIRWVLVSQEVTRAPRFDPTLNPRKEMPPKWRTM